jgi:hypothetical protein
MLIFGFSRNSQMLLLNGNLSEPEKCTSPLRFRCQDLLYFKITEYLYILIYVVYMRS